MTRAQRDSRALAGIALMVAAMQCVPVTDAIAKLVSQSLPVMMVVFLRSAAQGVFLLSFGVAAKRGGLPSRRSLFARSHVFRGFLWWISSVLFFSAIRDHDIPAALALFFTGPVFVAATAPLVLKERFDRRFLFAALAGFVGALFVLSPDLSGLQLGLLPALLGGICYGSYLMATRHAAQDRGLGAAEVALGASAWASVFGLPAAIWLWEPAGAEVWQLVAAMGAMSALGHLLIALASQRTDASRLAPYWYTEMFGAVVASYFIFATLPGPSVWVGIAMIIAAGIWATAAARQRPVDAIV